MMLIKMRKGARQESIQRVIDKIAGLNCRYWFNLRAKEKVIILLGSDAEKISTEIFEGLPEVEKAIHIKGPYILASRGFQKENTVVKIEEVEIGSNKIIIAAGPCAVESKEQILSCAHLIKNLGGQILRGGAFKPRTSPFAFQGLKEEGLELLAQAREETGLLILTEIMASEDVPLLKQYINIFQIGARNMQNYRLLEAVGKTELPILLKRGYASTIEEWLTAADYLLREGNSRIILCERGIRTFNSSSGSPTTRFAIDPGVIPIVKKVSHLPVIIDPSHAAGYFEYVPALAKAGIAAGADGLLIEIHPNPQKALSDGPQQLTFADFSRLMEDLKKIAAASGREM
jgi:3-deoxy-7-phosphoheptulonate synthase